MRLKIVIFFILLGVGIAPKLLANETIFSQTQIIIDDLNSARTKLSAADSYPNRIKALSNLIQKTENSLSDLRSKYRFIKLRTEKLNKDLIFQKEKISKLAGALLVVGQEPLQSKLLHPEGALNTARSSLILSDILEGVRTEAGGLSRDLEKLQLLKNLSQKAEKEMQLSLEIIQTARATLVKAASDRTDLPLRFIDDPEKISSLSKSSKSLGEFAVALNSLERKLIIPNEPILKNNKGGLTLPAEGVVTRKFNEADAAGIVRPGIIIRTKEYAFVTSPVAATVRYAGPLSDYGMVSILEPSEGILFIFAGLNQVFGEPGQILPEASLVGLMGGENIKIETFTTEKELNSGRLSQSLYIEVRRNDEPQNPFDWFEFNKE